MPELTTETIIFIAVAVFLAGVAASALASALFTVDTGTRKIVQRFGRFLRVADPGLNFKVPFIDQIAAAGHIDDDGDRDEPMDMRIQQLDLEVETKTKDNTFVKVYLAIQYQVIDAEKAFYKLDDPKAQISAYVFDVVRSQVPHMLIDEAFEKKNEIANQVKGELSQDMGDFGYEIIGALVTDVEPEGRVKAAMNDIVASQRERIAAEARGEASKILAIKAAEAEAESKKLQGEGIANQRKAIVAGLQESVQAFEKTTGVEAKEVMSMVLLTQYFDTLKEIGATGKSNTILMPHSPGALQDLLTQLQGSLLATSERS